MDLQAHHLSNVYDLWFRIKTRGRVFKNENYRPFLQAPQIKLTYGPDYFCFNHCDTSLTRQEIIACANKPETKAKDQKVASKFGLKIGKPYTIDQITEAFEKKFQQEQN